MRTAIIKTNFWEEDSTYNLSTDSKLLYLCILTNPKRDTTRAVKVSDRFLSAQTGFNQHNIEITKKDLAEKGFIEIIDDYIIIKPQDFVSASKGRLTKHIQVRDVQNIPDNILKKLEERDIKEKFPMITLEDCKDVITTSDILKSFENINKSCGKLYGNKTQRKACQDLIEIYGHAEVEKMIKYLPQVNKLVPSFHQIHTPKELFDKYAKTHDFLKTLTNKKDYGNKYTPTETF